MSDSSEEWGSDLGCAKTGRSLPTLSDSIEYIDSIQSAVFYDSGRGPNKTTTEKRKIC